MPGRIRIGTSGWNYPHWRGRFYPARLPQREWFAAYARVFDTVEINNTFYHQPSAASFDAWRKQAPPGFLYSVKANRYITHMKKLKEPDEALGRFLAGAHRLGKHLGPVLFQLPPNWRPDLDRLEGFLEVLPRDRPCAFEFRNREWLSEDLYALLERSGAALCIHDMLPRHPRRLTSSLVYLRLHGSGREGDGRYGKARLSVWAHWIRQVAPDHDVFVYFNNDRAAHAISDAGILAGLLAE